MEAWKVIPLVTLTNDGNRKNFYVHVRNGGREKETEWKKLSNSNHTTSAEAVLLSIPSSFRSEVMSRYQVKDKEVDWHLWPLMIFQLIQHFNPAAILRVLHGSWL